MFITVNNHRSSTIHTTPSQAASITASTQPTLATRQADTEATADTQRELDSSRSMLLSPFAAFIYQPGPHYLLLHNLMNL